jgi:hypothetical protein
MTDPLETVRPMIPENTASPEKVLAVAGQIEMMYHTLTAAYDLCQERISGGASDAEAPTFVILRELLKSMARDAELFVEALENKPGRLGYFEGHFGRI